MVIRNPTPASAARKETPEEALDCVPMDPEAKQGDCQELQARLDFL